MISARLISLAGMVLAFLLGLAIWLRSPVMPDLVPDSGIYLQFLPTVPLVYPTFVHVVGLSNLVTIQIAMYAFASAILAHRIAFDLGRPYFAIAATVLLFANPQLWSMLTTVMSEGLFLPIAVLWLALTVSFSATGKWGLAAGMALVAGFAVAVRPAAMPMLLLSPMLILLQHKTRHWQERIIAAGALLALSLVIVGGERIAWRTYHGQAGFTLTASHLFGKAALLPNSGPPPSTSDPVRTMVYQTLQTRYAPVREMLKAQHGTVGYPVLLSFYEVCAQHSCSHEMRDRMGISPREQNVIIAELAKQRIMANPLAYLSLAMDEYRSMWVIGVRSHPVLGPRYDAQIAAMGKRPLADVVAPEVALPVPTNRTMLLIRPAMVIMGISTAIIAVASLWLALCGRVASERTLPALAAAMAAHGIAIFIAIAGIGEGRYAMGIWPFTALALLFGLALLPQDLLRRMPVRSRSAEA